VLTKIPIPTEHQGLLDDVSHIKISEVTTTQTDSLMLPTKRSIQLP